MPWSIRNRAEFSGSRQASRRGTRASAPGHAGTALHALRRHPPLSRSEDAELQEVEVLGHMGFGADRDPGARPERATQQLDAHAKTDETSVNFMLQRAMVPASQSLSTRPTFSSSSQCVHFCTVPSSSTRPTLSSVNQFEPLYRRPSPSIRPTFSSVRQFVPL